MLDPYPRGTVSVCWVLSWKVDVGKFNPSMSLLDTTDLRWHAGGYLQENPKLPFLRWILIFVPIMSILPGLIAV